MSICSVTQILDPQEAQKWSICLFLFTRKQTSGFPELQYLAMEKKRKMKGGGGEEWRAGRRWGRKSRERKRKGGEGEGPSHPPTGSLSISQNSSLQRKWTCGEPQLWSHDHITHINDQLNSQFCGSRFYTNFIGKKIGAQKENDLPKLT